MLLKSVLVEDSIGWIAAGAVESRVNVCCGPCRVSARAPRLALSDAQSPSRRGEYQYNELNDGDHRLQAGVDFD